MALDKAENQREVLSEDNFMPTIAINWFPGISPATVEMMSEKAHSVLLMGNAMGGGSR